jgi:hypothetical protein
MSYNGNKWLIHHGGGQANKALHLAVRFAACR